MKNSLKLMLICIAALTIICIPFTAMADNHIRYRGVIDGLTNNPDTPKFGDTLDYISYITTSVRGGGGIPDTITGCRVTYSYPHEIIQITGARSGVPIPNTETDFGTGTITITISGLSPRSLLSIFDPIHFEVVGVGAGEIHMTGTVTTTQGTFDLGLDDPFVIKILPTPLPPPPPAGPVVLIPDANLAAAVRKALGLRANAEVPLQAMQRLTELDARESQIKNLTGLQHATQLQRLYLQDNQITDITPLAKLTQLTDLKLQGNPIQDTSPLASLTKLTESQGTHNLKVRTCAS